MSLKIQVDPSKLIDSPYNEANSFFFDYTSVDTDGIAQDLLNGTSASYLISGYRGTGKSSFIRKVELEMLKKEPKTLFVFLNFAKHEKQNILFRKVIRSFYLKFKEKGLFENLEDIQNNKSKLAKLEELYERTFYDVSRNSNERNTVTNTSVLGYNVSIKDLLLIPSSIIALILFVINLDLTQWSSYIFIGIALILFLIQFFSLETRKMTEDVNSSETSKTSFYDDEIAEYYIIETLNNFKDDIKPVFVFDELDKINDDELVENIINELKPIMLSGLAHFIIVAGQNLYYNYYLSNIQDDSALSSIFSKVHHLPLFSAPELRNLFRKMVKMDPQSLSETDQRHLNVYVDYIVFESFLIPRRFVTFLRQHITWEEKLAYINIDKTIEELEVYAKILKRIENIKEQEIDLSGYPDAIVDFLVMQLFLGANKVFKNPNKALSVDQIINEIKHEKD